MAFAGLVEGAASSQLLRPRGSRMECVQPPANQHRLLRPGRRSHGPALKTLTLTSGSGCHDAPEAAPKFWGGCSRYGMSEDQPAMLRWPTTTMTTKTMKTIVMMITAFSEPE